MLNPAKVRADYLALEEPAEVPTLVRKFGLGRRRMVALLGLLSAVLLAVSFPLVERWPLLTGEWYLAYVALVPWTLSLAGGGTRRWVLLCSFLAGGVFWSTMYWLTWVTMVGYVPLVLYLGLYWLAAGAVIRAALRRHWPAWIVLPVVWVALEYLRAYVMTGYTWCNLSLSQYRRVWLIQISDLTGHYGVSFFVAMVNGAIVDLCLAPWRAKNGSRFAVGRGALIAAGAPLVVLGALVSYGAWRVSEAEHTTTPGPVIGIVQENIPITFDASVPDTTRMRLHTDRTLDALKDTRCELVIWPETMLPSYLNPEMLSLTGEKLDALYGEKLQSLSSMVLGRRTTERWKADADELRVRLRIALVDGGTFEFGTIVPARAYALDLADLAREIGCPLLVGGATGHPNPDPVDRWDHWVLRNSALWFDPRPASDPTRHLAVAQYAKRHPVPFSEIVPFKHGWPWLHRQLRRLIPPGMPQLDPGEAATLFELAPTGRDGAGRTEPWRLGVVICFEGTFARRCREAVMTDGDKAADILVNLSNDGWFVTTGGGGVGRASTEHMQHMAQYCFRAVENRVPVVRAVNTGVSASIDSNGRVVKMLRRFDGVTAYSGSLLLGGGSTNGNALSQRKDPPVTADAVRVDSRVSLYSVIGDVFAMLVSVAAIVLAGMLIRRRPRRRQESEECTPTHA